MSTDKCVTTRDRQSYSHFLHSEDEQWGFALFKQVRWVYFNKHRQLRDFSFFSSFDSNNLVKLQWFYPSCKCICKEWMKKRKDCCIARSQAGSWKVKRGQAWTLSPWYSTPLPHYHPCQQPATRNPSQQHTNSPMNGKTNV